MYRTACCNLLWQFGSGVFLYFHFLLILANTHTHTRPHTHANAATDTSMSSFSFSLKYFAFRFSFSCELMTQFHVRFPSQCLLTVSYVASTILPHTWFVVAKEKTKRAGNGASERTKSVYFLRRSNTYTRTHIHAHRRTCRRRYRTASSLRSRRP